MSGAGEMTTQAAARRARSAGPRPFGLIDELNCYFDAPAEPNNVHLELWLPGHLDPARLRAAVAATLAAEPLAAGRRARGRWWDRGFAWEFPLAGESEAGADEDPVDTVPWRTEAELELSRERFMAAAPPLDRSPPFRLLLAQGQERDSLILNAHHAAFDGRSCLRLLRLIAEHYDGTGLVQPSPGPAWETRLPRTAGTARPGRRAVGGVRRKARIAPRHADGQRTRTAPGYGFFLLGWPGVPAVSGGTVNDLLIAALIETIGDWNAAAGRRPGRVLISMPVDAREPGHGDELGNLSRLCTVTADPSAPGLLAAVAAQTGPAKRQPGPPVGPALTAAARMPLPVAVKRRAVRLAVRTLGRVRCDTSLLSNLGNVTGPPRFGPLTPDRMWFSTTAHMPRGLSAGVVTAGGRLSVCFRYRHALFDAAAAAEFAGLYAAVLGRTP
jgi:NRPS condensation-like uncharacterized protein